MTMINDAMLTLALHHASNLKVQTAILDGNRDRARDLLQDYMELTLEEAPYLEGTARVETSRLAPHERAARTLTSMPGPLLHPALREAVIAAIPLH